MMGRIRQMREQEGFTLIELLIVIVILGILAAIVVFAVGGITDRGKKSACKADLKTVEVAQEAKFAKDSSYAASVGDLVPTYLKSAPGAGNGYTIATNNTGAVTVTVGATTGGVAVCDSL